MLRASKSPAVVHCLGAEVILKLTPKGGYKDVAESTASDKDKGRAKDENWTGFLPTEPSAGPSRHAEQDCENQASFIPEPEVNELPIVVDEPVAATDVVYQNPDPGDIAISDSNPSHFDPGMEVENHEVAEPKQEPVQKKNKDVKDKSKVSVPEISMTLVHGDCVVLYGDDFEVSAAPQ